MSGRFFLDTNIFVYSFDASSPKKAAQAQKLIRNALETGGGIVSYQVVQEFFIVALRRFSKPMSSLDAQQYLSTTFRPLLAVHSSPALYGEALRIGARFELPWYDSLIVASAIEGECGVLYSEDFQDGQQIGSLTLSNPFA
ncbi:MAG TPA: PIN domain-containing protein [Candidatus Sulfotelmatobacter sp.]|jgi:predicted nucleic acid-binding protein|nr:PIN domain-containing protein [Candidatus Sulfotelmatobacter sp.]